MRSLFRRILGRDELPGDIATDDWSPVPAGVSTQAFDLEALLATERPLPRSAALDWEPLLGEPQGLEGVSEGAQPRKVGNGPEEKSEDAGTWMPLPAPAAPEPRAAGKFTPEELAIIEEQRRAAAAPPPPAPEPPPQAPRQSWVDVLKSVGESLTDSELRIIREQLAT